MICLNYEDKLRKEKEASFTEGYIPGSYQTDLLSYYSHNPNRTPLEEIEYQSCLNAASEFQAKYPKCKAWFKVKVDLVWNFSVDENKFKFIFLKTIDIWEW